jgi:hypothetical protein
MGTRVFRALAAMTIAFAIGLAFAPLRAPAPALVAVPASGIDFSSSVAEPSTACGLPVIDAWHAKQPSGWFGYAPLTSVPVFRRVGCRAAAQDRLRTSGVVLLVGVFLALLAYASSPLRREQEA